MASSPKAPPSSDWIKEQPSAPNFHESPYGIDEERKMPETVATQRQLPALKRKLKSRHVQMIAIGRQKPL